MSERLFLPPDGAASSASAATQWTCAPTALLRSHVDSALLYREHLGDAEVIERVVPDGAVRLVFNFGDAPTTSCAVSGYPTEVIGATAAPALVRLRGTIEGWSIALKPGATLALLGVPASELTDTAVQLDELWAGEAERLRQRMASGQTNGERWRLIEQALLARVQRGQRRNSEQSRRQAAAAAQLIRSAAGRRSSASVANELGIGERRLQQLFRDHVGLSPRSCGRLARLHACLQLLRAGPPRWASVALDAGYYDQAHLANEFRALSGLSPSEFFNQSSSGSSKTAG